MASPQNKASHSPELANTQPPALPAHSSGHFRPTSQILGQSDSAVFSYNADDELARMPVGQIRHTDGKLYIEYIPGHNVLYLPASVPIERPIKRMRKAQEKREAQEARKVSNELAKPHNAFIRYRSFRLESIKQQFPNTSQVDLSRIAAEHWRTEDPEIKGFFQSQYKKELLFYHQQQKIKHMAAKFQEQDNIAHTAPASSSLHANNSQSPMDFSNICGPSHFNPKRRRSQSVPSEATDPYPPRCIRKQ
ncbi:hypothetical protein IWW50_000007 [Coemansia erecta]|nr:hypothetical protein GGF43_000131 [Coemansia sp. RSA 2618]KAJ2830786.1 hypothetical protein IWW50_000007 [Coemansia erecta]